MSVDAYLRRTAAEKEEDPLKAAFEAELAKYERIARQPFEYQLEQAYRRAEMTFLSELREATPGFDIYAEEQAGRASYLVEYNAAVEKAKRTFRESLPVQYQGAYEIFVGQLESEKAVAETKFYGDWATVEAQARAEYARAEAQARAKFLRQLRSSEVAMKRQYVSLYRKQPTPRILREWRVAERKSFEKGLAADLKTFEAQLAGEKKKREEAFGAELSTWEAEALSSFESGFEAWKRKAEGEFTTDLLSWSAGELERFDVLMESWKAGEKQSYEEQVAAWKETETTAFYEELTGWKAGEQAKFGTNISEWKAEERAGFQEWLSTWEKGASISEKMLKLEDVQVPEAGTSLLANLFEETGLISEEEAAIVKKYTPRELEIGGEAIQIYSSSYAGTKFSKEFMAGVVASVEAPVYSIGSLIGLKTPRPPPTVSGGAIQVGLGTMVSPILGSGLQKAGVQQLEATGALGFEYAMGSLIGDVAASYIAGELAKEYIIQPISRSRVGGWIGYQFRQHAPGPLLRAYYGKQMAQEIVIERQWGWSWTYEELLKGRTAFGSAAAEVLGSEDIMQTGIPFYRHQTLWGMTPTKEWAKVRYWEWAAPRMKIESQLGYALGVYPATGISAEALGVQEALYPKGLPPPEMLMQAEKVPTFILEKEMRLGLKEGKPVLDFFVTGQRPTGLTTPWTYRGALEFEQSVLYAVPTRYFTPTLKGEETVLKIWGPGTPTTAFETTLKKAMQMGGSPLTLQRALASPISVLEANIYTPQAPSRIFTKTQPTPLTTTIFEGAKTPFKLQVGGILGASVILGKLPISKKMEPTKPKAPQIPGVASLIGQELEPFQVVTPGQVSGMKIRQSQVAIQLLKGSIIQVGVPGIEPPTVPKTAPAGPAEFILGPTPRAPRRSTKKVKRRRKKGKKKKKGKWDIYELLYPVKGPSEAAKIIMGGRNAKRKK